MLDRFDVALLKKCSPNVFEFAKTPAQERRALDLYRKGYLEREWAVYRVGNGGKTSETRWSFRLSTKGANALVTGLTG